MQLSELLVSKKCTAPDQVVTCSESDPASRAISLMADNQIGAIVVTRNESVVGVYSERDVVRNCRDNESGFSNRKIGQVMSTNVVTVGPDQDVDNALQLMRKHNIRHLPVIDGDVLVGLVSLRDLMVAKLEYEYLKSEFLKGQVNAANRPLPM